MKTAQQSLADQKQRCTNPKSPSYKYYGGKGIRVMYSTREFIGWWLESLKSFKGMKPTVSRIDHDWHYEINNIKLEDHIDNCVKDVFARFGPPDPKTKRCVLVYDVATRRVLAEYKSMGDASRSTGFFRTNICRMCRTRSGITKTGITFRYKNDEIGVN